MEWEKRKERKGKGRGGQGEGGREGSRGEYRDRQIGGGNY